MVIPAGTEGGAGSLIVSGCSEPEARDEAMRLIPGIILGILITIGTAYVHDSWTSEPGAATEEQRMVNWDVVHRNFHDMGVNIAAEWNRLTDGLHQKT